MSDAGGCEVTPACCGCMPCLRCRFPVVLIAFIIIVLALLLLSLLLCFSTCCSTCSSSCSSLSFCHSRCPLRALQPIPISRPLRLPVLLPVPLPLPAGSDPVIPGVSDASSPGAGLPFVAMDADFRVDTAAVLAGAGGGR